MLTNASFSTVIQSWKSQLALDISNFKPLRVTKERVHILFPLEAHTDSPPEKLVVEINGSSLRVATRSVSLAEIEKTELDAISPWYRNTSLNVTANYDDNS